jgi:outer membrane biosynthesis protein TonB
VGNDNRPLQDYARWLAAQGVNPETVVTRLKFDTSAESPKLFFKAMRWLTDDEYEVIERATQSQEAIDAVTMSIAKPAPAAPAALPGAAPKAKAKAKPAPAADDEPPAPPPKAKAKPAPAAEEEPPAPPPKAKAKPAPAAEEEGDEEEPTVRKAAPTKPAAAIKPDLAKAIEDWDD